MISESGGRIKDMIKKLPKTWKEFRFRWRIAQRDWRILREADKQGKKAISRLRSQS